MPRARENASCGSKRRRRRDEAGPASLTTLSYQTTHSSHTQHNGVPHAPAVRGNSCSQADTHHIERLPRLPPRTDQEGTCTFQLDHKVCLITSNFPQRLPVIVPSWIPTTCRIPQPNRLWKPHSASSLWRCHLRWYSSRHQVSLTIIYTNNQEQR
jgi:hypothetical protein